MVGLQPTVKALPFPLPLYENVDMQHTEDHMHLSSLHTCRSCLHFSHKPMNFLCAFFLCLFTWNVLCLYNNDCDGIFNHFTSTIL